MAKLRRNNEARTGWGSIAAIALIAAALVGLVVAWSSSAEPSKAKASVASPTPRPPEKPRQLKAFREGGTGQWRISERSVCALADQKDLDGMNGLLPEQGPNERPSFGGRCQYLDGANPKYVLVSLHVEPASGGSMSDRLIRLTDDPQGVVDPHTCTPYEARVDAFACQRLVRIPRLGSEAWAIVWMNPNRASVEARYWTVDSLLFERNGLWVTIESHLDTLDEPTQKVIDLARLIDQRIPANLTEIENPCPPEGCS